MTYKLTHEERAFMTAYGKTVASASDYELRYYLENKQKINIGTYEEEKKIKSEINYWEHIEDHYMIWLEAIKYEKSPKLKTYRVRASYSCIAETLIEAKDEEQAQAIAKALDGSNFDETIDPDDWHIDRITEVQE